MVELANDSLAIELDRIARGDLLPRDALPALCTAVDAGGEFDGRIESALKQVAWQTLNTHASVERLHQWYEVFRRVSARLRMRSEDEGSHRMAWGLEFAADLFSRSIKFAELQQLGEVLGRINVRQVLDLLERSEDPLSRDAIADALSLNEGNLSRVLAVLEVHELVTCIEDAGSSCRTWTSRTQLAQTNPAPTGNSRQ